jgi:hypothetical protein
MEIISLEQFIDALPKLTADISDVIVATYNNLDSYKNGGEVSANGKKVTILCGGAAYADVEGAQNTKVAGARKVSEGLARPEANSLVILYAGKSRFGEMVGLAYRLAGRGNKVVLVGCGCDPDIFDPLTPDPNITFVMPRNDFCNGGRGDLSRVVEAILK